MLFAIVAILFILWLLGFTMEFAGNLIHFLLVVALVLLIYRLLTGRKVVE